MDIDLLHSVFEGYFLKVNAILSKDVHEGSFSCLTLEIQCYEPETKTVSLEI